MIVPDLSSPLMIYRFNNYSLDTSLYELKDGENLVSVEPQVFDLLVYLIANMDRVLTRGELLDNLWQRRGTAVPLAWPRTDSPENVRS